MILLANKSIFKDQDSIIESMKTKGANRYFLVLSTRSTAGFEIRVFNKYRTYNATRICLCATSSTIIVHSCKDKGRKKGQHNYKDEYFFKKTLIFHCYSPICQFVFSIWFFLNPGPMLIESLNNPILFFLGQVRFLENLDLVVLKVIQLICKLVSFIGFCPARFA